MKNLKYLLVMLVMAANSNFVRSETVAPAADIIADDAQKALATAYVAAVNAKDLTKLKTVIHPKSLAEITDENHAFYDFIFAGELKDAIPADYKLVIQPVSKVQLDSMKNFATFSVEPTHTMQFAWFFAPNSNFSRVIFVVNENGKWLDLLPVPTPATMQQIKTRQAAQQKP